MLGKGGSEIWSHHGHKVIIHDVYKRIFLLIEVFFTDIFLQTCGVKKL